MKIIGHTEYGYVAELSKSEVRAIAGKDHENQYERNGRPTIPIGTKLDPSDTWRHLEKLIVNESRRKEIAEQFRAMATMIEHTPTAIEFPPEKKTTEQATS